MKKFSKTAGNLNTILFGSVFALHGILTSLISAETWTIQTSEGRPVHREILGQTWAAYLRSPFPKSATSMRGVAAGLAADSYDWKKRTGYDSLNVGTTLEYLRACRDNGWTPLVTANLRGTFAKDGPGNQFANMDPQHIAKLAADWVTYCNTILPEVREGDPVTNPEIKRILDSIEWSPKLLAKNEEPPPKITHWELGNEPAVGAGNSPDGKFFSYQDHPERYVNAYQAVSAAMLNADRSIKLGPSFSCGEAIDPLKERPHVDALFRSGLPMHFISYHGYAHLHHHWPDAAEMSKVLKTEAWHGFVESKHLKLADKLRETGHDPEKMDFILSEYNTASWGDNNAQVSMARALGTAANLFAFMERGYLMANTWDPVTYSGVKWPVLLVYEMFYQNLGGVFLGSYVNDGFLVCATRSENDPDLLLWAVNLNLDRERILDVRFTDSPGLNSATVVSLGNPRGVTSMTDRNTALDPNRITWSMAIPVPIDKGSIRLIVKPSEISVFKLTGRLPAARIANRLVDQSVSIKPPAGQEPAVLLKAEIPVRQPIKDRPVVSYPLTRRDGIKLVGPNATIDPIEGLILKTGSYAVIEPGPIVPVGPGCEATFAIWFRTDKPGTLFCKSENHAGPSSHEYALLLEKWGVRSMSAVNIKFFKPVVGSGNGSFIDNQWHHVALVCRDNLGVFYIDGIDRGRFDSLQSNVTLNQPLLLGARSTIRPDAIDANFEGRLRDLRIYQRALGADEIKAIAASAKP